MCIWGPNWDSGFPLAARLFLIAMAGFAIFVLGGRPLQQGYDIRIDSTQRQALRFYFSASNVSIDRGLAMRTINPMTSCSWPIARVLLSYENTFAFP